MSYGIHEQSFETRNHNLDLLRIFAMLAVIVIHAAAPYFLHSPTQSSTYIISLTYDSFARFCVPVFVMISGAVMFSLGKDIDQHPWKFYSGKIKRFLPPVLFWFTFYFVFSGAMGSLLNSKNLEDVRGNLWAMFIAGPPYYHLWYLFLLPGIFFMGPLLMHLKRAVTPKQWLYLGISLLLVGMIHNAWRQMTGSYSAFFAEILDFIGYLILGDALLQRKFSRLWSFLGFVAGSILLAVAIYIYTLSHPGAFYFDAFLSPFIMVPSISLYIFVNQGISFAKSKVLYDLALSSFGIYLVHAAVIDTVLRATNRSLTSNVTLDIFLYTVITLGISYAIVKILRTITVTRWMV